LIVGGLRLTGRKLAAVAVAMMCGATPGRSVVGGQ